MTPAATGVNLIKEGEDTSDTIDTSIEAQSARPFLSVKNLENNTKMIKYYTGFENYDHLCYIFDLLMPAAMELTWKSKSLEPFDEFFLTIVKLRQDKDDLELAFMFNISRWTAGRIFSTWLSFMFYQFKELNIWLDKDVIQEYMPEVIFFLILH